MEAIQVGFGTVMQEERCCVASASIRRLCWMAGAGLHLSQALFILGSGRCWPLIMHPSAARPGIRLGVPSC